MFLVHPKTAISGRGRPARARASITQIGGENEKLEPGRIN